MINPPNGFAQAFDRLSQRSV